MITITRSLLREWCACYDDARIAELIPAEGLTPQQILALEIPAADRLWVVLREDVIPARELRLLACTWADRALDRLPPTLVDTRSREAIAVARRYAIGAATDAELSAADAAAWAAAAWAAAADAAAWAAAAAADAAAWAAAAAAGAERDRQIAGVRAVLRALAFLAYSGGAESLPPSSRTCSELEAPK